MCVSSVVFPGPFGSTASITVVGISTSVVVLGTLTITSSPFPPPPMVVVVVVVLPPPKVGGAVLGARVGIGVVGATVGIAVGATVMGGVGDTVSP